MMQAFVLLSVRRFNNTILNQLAVIYSWYGVLDKEKVIFGTRLKSNSKAYVYGNKRKPDSAAVIRNQKVKIPGYTYTFRRIDYIDPETGEDYQ